MNDKEYLEIILKGWSEDTGGYLANHFYREWKKAEGNHYSLVEFFLSAMPYHGSRQINLELSFFVQMPK